MFDKDCKKTYFVLKSVQSRSFKYCEGGTENESS